MAQLSSLKSGLLFLAVVAGPVRALAQCNAPSGLSATSVTANTATISWNAVSGATGYEYLVDQNPGTPLGFGVYTPNTTVPVTMLNSANTYYYHVRSQCGSSTVSPWSIGTFTTQGGCLPPASISASAITNTGATVSWPAASGVTSYEYVVSISSVIPSGAGTPTTATSAAITSLSPGNTYYAFVRSACGGNSFSGWTYAPFTTTGTNSCTAPAGLAVSGITNSAANFSWNAVPGATGYEYVVDFTPGPPVSAATPVATNSLGLSGLLPSTAYYIHVRTLCSQTSVSGWTNLPFTTAATSAGCLAPTGISFSNITNSSVNVTWQPVSGAVGYEWIINTSAAAPTSPGSPTTQTTAFQPGLQAGTTYYAHIRTDCGTSFSSWTSVTFTTSSAAPCPVPTGLTITGITATGATLSWNTAAGTTGFEYLVDNSAATPATAGTAVASTTTVLSGLTPSTTYYAHVRSQCGTTFSAWATSASFATKATGIAGVGGSASLVIYPNPVKDAVTIRTSGRDGRIRITDLSGRMLADREQSGDVTVINMTGFAPDIYLVRYMDARQSEVVQLVKE